MNTFCLKVVNEETEEVVAVLLGLPFEVAYNSLFFIAKILEDFSGKEVKQQWIDDTQITRQHVREFLDSLEKK